MLHAYSLARIPCHGTRFNCRCMNEFDVSPTEGGCRAEELPALAREYSYIMDRVAMMAAHCRVVRTIWKKDCWLSVCTKTGRVNRITFCDSFLTLHLILCCLGFSLCFKENTLQFCTFHEIVAKLYNLPHYCQNQKFPVKPARTWTCNFSAGTVKHTRMNCVIDLHSPH